MTQVPEKPVRIVVAGCGNMAHAWIRHAQERADCRLVGFVDLNPLAARAMAEKYQVPDAVVGNDLAGILNQTRASLVFNLAIPEAHRPIALTAFAAGCAVMSEKPLAANLAEADEMIGAAREQNLFFGVMQNRRFLKQIRSFRRIVDDGIIGKPGTINADFYLGPRFGGFRDLMDDPLLLDMAIHTFDQARFILRADARQVYCHAFNPPGSWYRGNASAIAIFTMSDSSVFCYRGSWCSIGYPTSWEADWRVSGSQGTAVWDGKSMPWAEVLKPETPNAQAAFMPEVIRVDARDDGSGREGHDGCLDELFDALLSGRPAETDAADNRNSLAMVMAAIESAQTGKRVNID